MFRRRAKPDVEPDRVVLVGLPAWCPCCGDEIVLERVAEQWMTELPEPHVVVTRFDVEIGRCVGCETRVQGRHPEQTSDALGAAGVMLGPRGKAMAAVLHYCHGLSFMRCAEVMRAMGIEVTAGGIVAASASMAKDVKDLLIDALGARDLAPPSCEQQPPPTSPSASSCCSTVPPRGWRPTADNRRLAKHLSRQGAAVFTFLTNPDVDATNWRAEQAIRPAVVNRKVWGGNRTDHGARTWERLVTVLTTCRQQGLDTLRVLIDLAHRPAPALAIPIH
jgi:hypothetical protein